MLSNASSAFTRWLRWAATLAKWSLGVVAALWLVVALLWYVLHFFIVPRIDNWRPQIQEYAERALGAPVRLGRIVVTSNGLVPSFAVRDVMVLDPQQRVALHLPRVDVAISPRSLLRGGVEQLYVDAPELDIRRSADGRLWVAGLPLPVDADGSSPAVDWVFSQAELATRHGTVHWTDEQRGAPRVTLSDVSVVLRNGFLRHQWRVDATPPAHWGQRFSVLGQFRSTRVLHRAGDWKRWRGQVYVDLPYADTRAMALHLPWLQRVEQGQGGLRAWVDVDEAVVRAATLDVQLQALRLQWERSLPALALRQLRGRLSWAQDAKGWELATEQLGFVTDRGLRWPGGNVRLAISQLPGRSADGGHLEADRIDVATVAQLASHFPVTPQVRAAVARAAPRGLVERLQARWSGDWQQPQALHAQGRVEQLTVQHSSEGEWVWPGIEGATVDFEWKPGGGKAHLAVRNGSVHTLDVFEQARIPLDQLDADVQWTQGDGSVALEIERMSFSNADAQGDLSLSWKTDAAARGAQRYPGILDLQGRLTRAQAKQVPRYMPRVLDAEVRTYLADAIVSGAASNVQFKVKGNLRDFPFEDPRKGEFRIAARLHDVVYAFLPPRVAGAGSLPWPVLDRFTADFVIDRSVLQVKGAQGGVLGVPGLQVQQAEAQITDLYHHAALVVNAQAKGAASDALRVVNGSPLGGLMNQALSQTHISGGTDVRFKLALPIADPERATVQGSVTLAGNDVQITPDSPRFSRAHGVVAFNEHGFSISGGRARALGGELRMEGGLSIQNGSSSKVLRLQGVASAEGLRQATELGLIARLGHYTSGQTPYVATVGVRQGVMELHVNSNLQGLAVRLPAPFEKAEGTAVPMHFSATAVPATAGLATQDQWRLEIGRLLQLQYVRDVSTTVPRVLRGAVALGLAADEMAPVPPQGVQANIRLDVVDVDAWQRVVNALVGAEVTPQTLVADNAASTLAYLPTTVALRARTLQLGGRQINHVVVGGARDGLLWRANVDAAEASGYVEYRQSSGATPGRVYARLARLAVAASTAQQVETLLDQQPTSIPALDIEVQDFELRGKKLGRLDIEAVNLGVLGPRDGSAREWRLNRFNMVTPEATLAASGNWIPVSGTGGGGIKDRRRTALNFKLDIQDAGALLDRFEMRGVFGKGRGKIEGRVEWQGSPITLDYASLGGSFNINVEKGQFLKADPGIAKLLGVLSLQSLPRRLVLDFRDVFSDGFAFDFLRGDVNVEKGIARTNNLQMKGVNAAVMMEGQADIAKETQSLRVVVVPEINAGSASVLAAVINPLVGLSTFLAQAILRRPVIDSNTQEFLIDGTWTDPRVTKVDRKAPPKTETSP